MIYKIVLINKNGNNQLLSTHNNLDDAKAAGKAAFDKTTRNQSIICMSGNIDDNGNINGKYLLYEVWD